MRGDGKGRGRGREGRDGEGGEWDPPLRKNPGYGGGPGGRLL